jgi:hypothetical protein
MRAYGWLVGGAPRQQQPSKPLFQPKALLAWLPQEQSKPVLSNKGVPSLVLFLTERSMCLLLLRNKAHPDLLNLPASLRGPSNASRPQHSGKKTQFRLYYAPYQHPRNGSCSDFPRNRPEGDCPLSPNQRVRSPMRILYKLL